jgi:hypothetical protein
VSTVDESVNDGVESKPVVPPKIDVLPVVNEANDQFPILLLNAVAPENGVVAERTFDVSQSVIT